MDLDPDIARHYEHGLEGERRTARGRLDAARTRELLARFVPAAPAEVRDGGGAEGADALTLARAEHAVELTEQVAGRVELARPQPPPLAVGRR